jgi:hypothetical protein
MAIQNSKFKIQKINCPNSLGDCYISCGLAMQKRGCLAKPNTLFFARARKALALQQLIQRCRHDIDRLIAINGY